MKCIPHTRDELLGVHGRVLPSASHRRIALFAPPTLTEFGATLFAITYSNDWHIQIRCNCEPLFTKLCQNPTQ